jgi:predicted AlkP superfamily phosphohydrolase/phosphomutase
METLLIGLDAACWPVLDPLIEDGELPYLREICRAGIGGELESQIPPWTASAWPSMYTGMNPGKHGVFDFITFEGYDYRVVNATDVRERPLWHLLDKYGLSSIVVNVPVTYPPRPFDGALVPGYMAPEDPRCHPTGLLEDIRGAIGEYRVYPGHTGSSMPPPSEAVEEYRALVRMRGEATRYLADRFDPDFGFVQFQQTDTLFHEYPGEQRVVREVYRAVDEEVGRMLDDCTPETVIVVSDHGIGPYNGSEFRPNELLREAGFVETTRMGEGMPTWATIRDRHLANEGPEVRRLEGALERVTAAAASLGLTSQRLSRILGAIGLDEAVATHVPSGVVRAATEQVDFAESSAYMRSRIELGIRINLEGREPEGRVSPDDYDRVRDELVSLFKAVRAPDGSPVFEDVALREEYFHGPAAEDAVDVVIIPSNFDQFMSTRVGDGQFGEPSEPWNHKRHGIIAAVGAAIESETTLDDPHLFDVAPTVLATLGVPADERMDGLTLPIVSRAGRRAYKPPDSRAPAPANDTGVESHLANLGYLE